MTFSSFYLLLLLESFSQFSTLFYFLLLRHLPCFVIFIAILVLFATIITLLIGFLGLPPPPHPPYLRLYRLSPSSLTRVHDDYPRASRHAMSIVNPPVSWKITDRGRRRWASLLDPRVHVSLHTYERINNAHIIYPFNIRLNPTVPFFQRFFLPRLKIIYRSLLFIIVLTILIYRNICDVYYINVSIT